MTELVINGEEIIFPSGARVRANQCIVGLDAAAGASFSDGYDGGFEVRYNSTKLTVADCVLLAEHMARRWEEVATYYKSEGAIRHGY